MDEFVDQILARSYEHVVESGTSISGPAHIGNACDVIYAEAVKRLVEERGGKATSIWVADDLDPLDSVPYPLDLEEFKRYLGMPYTEIPDPYRCCSNWAEHFTKDFVDVLEKLGLTPQVKSGAKMYRDGTYLPFIRKALSRAEKVRKIFEEVSGAKKPPTWLPYMPICDNCGRIATTLAYSYEGDKVLYRCVLDVKYVKGCGYEGEVDIKAGRGKLQWRVEWAARWAAFNVTVEPFGKEHAAAGGSYDTSKVIIKEVFESPPPTPLVYEHVMIAGRKMSKSKGLVFTPRDWLEVAPPETLKFFFFRVHPTKHKDFRVENLPRLVEEYDRAERIYFDLEHPPDEKSEVLLKRSYVLSQRGKPPSTMPLQLPYDFAAALLQIYPSLTVDKVLEIMERTGHLSRKPTMEDIKRLEERLAQVRTWLSKYAPPSAKFMLVEDASKIQTELTPLQREALKRAAEELVSREFWGPRELNERFFSIARELGLKPPEFFEAAYLALTGRRAGPWLANFALAIGLEVVARRFKEAAGME